MLSLVERDLTCVDISLGVGCKVKVRGDEGILYPAQEAGAKAERIVISQWQRYLKEIKEFSNPLCTGRLSSEVLL